MLPMHDLIGPLLGIVVGAVWWISLLIISILHKRIAGDYEGWKGMASYLIAFALAGLCTVMAAHYLEHIFHVRILDRGDD